MMRTENTVTPASDGHLNAGLPSEIPCGFEPPASVGALGLIRAFRSNILAAFSADFYAEPRISFHRLGHLFICLNDPGDIDHVLNTHIDRYQPNVLARRLLEPIVGQGLLFSEGETWRRQHGRLAPFFQARSIERLIPSFHETAMSALASWPRDGLAERDLLADFRKLTLAVIARSLLSIDDERRTAELAAHASEAESSGALLEWRDYVALLLFRGVGQPRGRLETAAQWRLWVQALIDGRPPVDDGDAPRDMIDVLRAAGASVPAPRDEIVDQVGTMLSAGFITTAIALFWTALMLALYPERQDELRRELCRGDPRAAPDWATLRSSRTAIAFLYETLRLFPPAYVIAREARVEDRIGDFIIPRGATVIVAPWVVHRHALHWSEPDRFAPERFFEGGRIVTPRAWMPFGVGPRVCIGSAFATMEILVVLRCLLFSYHVGLKGPVPLPVGRVTVVPEFHPTFTLSPIA